MASPSSSPEFLQSAVLTSPADGMLSAAIALTLQAPPAGRPDLFLGLVRDIESFMAAQPQERPWTCTVFTGTDGCRIFRGGVGHSLVIDPDGRLWRARSYEDFETTYTFTQNSCEIASLTPLYDQMSEYRSRCRRTDGSARSGSRART
jgi:hypothetical protein